MANANANATANLLASNANLDTLAQLYRSIISSGGQPNSSNNQTAAPNLNEFLTAYNANFAALTLNPDLVNTANILNLANTTTNSTRITRVAATLTMAAATTPTTFQARTVPVQARIGWRRCSSSAKT